MLREAPLPGKAPLAARRSANSGAALHGAAGRGDALDWRLRRPAVGVSLRAVQRIWQAHRLQPHRIRTFKKSNDPAIADKVEDIVGLVMDLRRMRLVRRSTR